MHEVITHSESKQATTVEQQQIDNTNAESMNDMIRGDDEHKAGFEGRRMNKRRKRDDPINGRELQEMVIHICLYCIMIENIPRIIYRKLYLGDG